MFVPRTSGKERRRGKFAGYRPDWKKAYVRLKSGEKMPEYATEPVRRAEIRPAVQNEEVWPGGEIEASGNWNS